MHRRYNPTCRHRSLVLDTSDNAILFPAHSVRDGELQFLHLEREVEAKAKVIDVGSSTDEFGWCLLVGIPIVQCGPERNGLAETHVGHADLAIDGISMVMAAVAKGDLLLHNQQLKVVLHKGWVTEAKLEGGRP